MIEFPIEVINKVTLQKMKTRFDERYESDPTPSREVVRQYREALFDNVRDVSLAMVHYRGGEEEFKLGKEYSRSDDAGDRAVGAEILAELGWGDHTFQEESVAILTELLRDTDSHVIYSAAVGLGYRSATSAIPELLSLVDHADPLVRIGVVFGLSGLDDDRAIAALIQFTRDEDHDIRNWAVFGLGSLIDTDSQEIRDALRHVLSDSDHEIRGEALVGLAKRGDCTIVPELLNEWRNDEISILSIEAAAETRDPRLLPELRSFTKILTLGDNPEFLERLADAIKACEPKEECG